MDSVESTIRASHVVDEMTLRVRTMTWECPGVVSLELVATDGGSLPPFAPGAHVDVHLNKDVVRQYSLCGDPADRARYRIAVREIAAGHASRLIHHQVRPGDLLRVVGPRNNFPLVRAARYIFIAGGIGVTPLLPMMRAATQAGAEWTLLFCVRNTSYAPFLSELGGNVRLHESEAGTRLDVAARLSTVEADTHVYCCGPASLMTAVESATAGWPGENVHFEWFKPREQAASTSADAFDVVCAQSGITVSVVSGRSILDTLTDAGIAIPRSCEQGICGTCECRVLEGEIEHRDSILSSAERAAGQSMMVCVSRAKSARLVLDI